MKALLVLFFVTTGYAYTLYNTGDPIAVFTNRLGPYDNPSVNYPFYSLPFCGHDLATEKDQHLGEKLEGDFKQTSGYQLNFKIPTKNKKLCEVTWDEDQLAKIKDAIRESYYFEFVIDELNVGGFVGYFDEESGRYFIWRHLDFIILHNPDADPEGSVIIHANITSDDSTRWLELPKNKKTLFVEFTYSVNYFETDADPSERHFYSLFHPLDIEIHWLSIINSFVLVILLTGFLAIILLRILKSDYANYTRQIEEDEDPADYGWKLIHGDVFRFPTFRSFFTAFIGVGAQFLTMSFFMLLVALVGMYYPGNDGAILVSTVVFYALTAGVAGFTANYFYKQMGGTSWTWNTIITTFIFALPFLVVAFIINTIAAVNSTLNALPIDAVLVVIAIWLFIGFPLTLIGGIAGKRFAPPFYAPVRTKNFPRQIPVIPFYRRLPTQMIMAGFLPFSAIYIELFYIFNSVWGRAPYQLWGILALVFLILLIVTACITVALTYFQLSMEDWRWWWNSFFTGGATGLFIYAYSIFYFFYRSNMSGFLQASFFFGYMGIVSYFFFIMLGTVGFLSSLMFVRVIYRNIHVE